MPYESGIVPTGDARQRFSVKFYLVGMLFILFDIEAIFLYPWVVVFREPGMAKLAFVEMLVFVVLILSGFLLHLEEGRAGLVGIGPLAAQSANGFDMLTGQFARAPLGGRARCL